MIAKNEEAYLIEWVAYHRLIGFDNILIYENKSTDNSAKILAGMEKYNLIKLIGWRLGATESPQITAYTDAIKNCKTDWIFFIDADEFLVFNQGDLKSLLASHHNNEEVAAIAINWRIFGSSDHKVADSRPVIERFTKCSKRDFAMNNHVKSFLRINSIGAHIDMHLSDVNGQIIFPSGEEMEIESRGRSKIIDHDHVQINHYFCKTPQEYEVKRKRGQAGIGENSDLKYWYNDDAFHYHDRNEETDTKILELLPALKHEIEAIKARIKI